MKASLDKPRRIILKDDRFAIRVEEELYEKYQSLRMVHKLTGIPVSTLWYRLSKKNRLCRKTIVKEIAEDNELLKGTYVGLWAGDGSRYYDTGFISKIHLDKRDEDLAFFCKTIIKRLFKKNVKVYSGGEKNKAAIKIHSKFVYQFPERYLDFSSQKSKSVRLKDLGNSEFLKGVLLGLTLSDGYLKDKFVFASVSSALAKQVSVLLQRRGFSPKTYVHKRHKYGWSDLHLVRLSNEESRQLKSEFEDTLSKLNIGKSFDALKRYERE